MSNDSAELRTRMNNALIFAGQSPEEAPEWLSVYTQHLLRQYLFTNGGRKVSMEGRFFRSEGASIYDENFDFDAMMRVSGDFVDGEANQYAAMIADALNQVAHGGLK